MIRLPPRSTLFPYTTLFRSPQPLGPIHAEIAIEDRHRVVLPADFAGTGGVMAPRVVLYELSQILPPVLIGRFFFREDEAPDKDGDRKSTRLNSSHLVISYAV